MGRGLGGLQILKNMIKYFRSNVESIIGPPKERSLAVCKKTQSYTMIRNEGYIAADCRGAAPI